jgi:hypothetical protein
MDNDQETSIMKTSPRTWLLALALSLAALLPAARPSVAQFGPSGFRQGGVGSGQFPGGPGGIGSAQFPGSGQFPGGPGGIGRQGGLGLGPGSGMLATGRSVQIAANCTDLFLSGPDAKTAYSVVGDTGLVQLAGGPTLTLGQAVATGVVVIRGPGLGVGSAIMNPNLITLYLTNAASAPIRYDLPPGLLFVPVGQSLGTVPAGLDRLVAQAGSARLLGKAPLQLAVWAARGSTREDVEAIRIEAVLDRDAQTTQQLLDASGIERVFDRERGDYARRYAADAKQLSDAAAFEGTAHLGTGKAVTVDGYRAKDETGLIALHLVKGSGDFYYRARFQPAGKNKLVAHLGQLKTGYPLEANRGEIQVTLKPAG